MQVYLKQHKESIIEARMRNSIQALHTINLCTQKKKKEGLIYNRTLAQISYQSSIVELEGSGLKTIKVTTIGYACSVVKRYSSSC